MTQPTLDSVVEPIRRSQPFRRLAQCLRDAGLDTIYDCHAHTCAGRSGARPGVSPADIAETPVNAIRIADIVAFYDALFGPDGIAVRAVVFDTPLLAYDLRQRNAALLAEAGATQQVESSIGQRVVPFAVVTPDMTRAEIEGYANGGARGFKMSPRTTAAYAAARRVADVPLAAMLTPALLAVAAERRLPLLIHLPQAVSGASVRRPMLAWLAEAMTARPTLTVVLAHLGLCQTPARLAQLGDWIRGAGLQDRVYLETSTVTIADALAAALSGPSPLVFGTDLDFGFIETGRYLPIAEREGRVALADARDAGARAHLVGERYGGRYRDAARQAGVTFDAPLFVYQVEATLAALDAVEPSRRAAARALFAGNAERLLGL